MILKRFKQEQKVIFWEEAKNLLKLDQLIELWKKFPESEIILELIKKRVTDPRGCLDIIKATKHGTKERDKALSITEEVAAKSSIKVCWWLFTIPWLKPEEKAIIFEVLKGKIQTFRDWDFVVNKPKLSLVQRLEVEELRTNLSS